MREKVIKGLECCLPMTTRNGFADCKNCPYDRKITFEGGICECCHELMSDALELVKAQEPRLMTLEEVKVSEGKDMYLEMYNYPGSATYITAATLDGVGSKGVSFYHSVFDFAAYNKCPYGWRCWSGSKPNLEQMNNTPWEERNNGEKAE